MLRERIDFLRGPGGLRAAGYFGLKLVTGIEVFRVISTAPHSSDPGVLPPGWSYLNLNTIKALENLSLEVVAQLAGQSGSEPRQLIQGGGSLHLLLNNQAIVAQLRIDFGPSCQVDSPALKLTLTRTDAFLSYLYTWPTYRRRGAAGYLISATTHDLVNRGMQRVLAHVRATNVPSLAAFEQAGWIPCATIFCSLRGRLLASLQHGNCAIKIRASKLPAR